MSRSRRELLEAAGAGLSVTLAGCASTDAGDDTTTAAGTPESETTTETTTNSETTTTDETTTSDAKTATITAVNDRFDPVRLSVEPGTTVTWENRESGTYSSHSVTSAQFHEEVAEWSFDESLGKDESISYTFEDAGVYEYYCTVHGEGAMCGAVLVGDATLDQSLPCEES